MAEFSNVQDAYENLRQHELQTNSRYASSKVTKDFGKIGLETAKKVFWEDPSEVLHGRINFSGTPFVILGRKIFDCQFGKNRKEKRKLQKDLERRDEDHRYTKGKKFLMQDSKKIGCPARCVFREICRFPTFTAICMIKVNLRKRFQKLKDSSSIYSVHYVIPSVANEDLKSFFEEETGQSENYIYKVMVKEAMITIMQEAIGDEYENVDVELRKTEGKTTNKSNSLLLNYIMNDREKYIQLHKRN
ncbi:uncharacterized protein LOC123555183 [Mercenaria mercenaria]|uniref:uncharacterized protein LOC123555183 n=1 Tax=Mercenaria mercenaria TaxID=6596 RepID=UPI001E1D9628|nr:uncharacterized protein LOC123555183 [Mercenaria mercenaria]